MKCRITIDAIRDVELEGSVQSVSDYPGQLGIATVLTLKNTAPR